MAGGALSLSRSFNGYGEVESEGFTVNSQNVTSWSLARDKAGRITEKTETVGGVNSHYVYTYDPMGRLRTVTKDGALVEEYQYGNNGARTSEINTLKGITTPRTFTYSDEDHLLTAGTTQYQYDADGFLVTKTKGTEITEYAYSSRGELLQVKLPDTRVIDYIHDPYGRRIAKVVNGTITEKYLWQGLTSLLAVYDGAGNLLMRFDYADARMPVSMTKGGTTYYLTYDQVGSLRVVADASGNVVKKIDYDSFGNIINDTNPSFTIPFGFAGGLHDRDISLIRFGFRDYDPDIGRWTAKDPLIFKAGDTDLYGYCLNDPISFVDPLGLYGGAGPHHKWHWLVLYNYLRKNVDIGVGANIGVIDVTYTFNKKEWHTDIVTPGLGGGGFICFNLCGEKNKPAGEKKESACENDKQLPSEPPLEPVPFTYSVGTKRSSLSFSDDFCTVCINYGPSLPGLPINVSSPLF